MVVWAFPRLLRAKPSKKPDPSGLPRKADARKIPTRNATKFGRYLTAMSILDSTKP